MAKSATGRWVSRVGASGGGKAYKKTRPGNFYGAIVVIVILGLASTVFARYDYEHPPKRAPGVAPKIGTTWFAALSIEACGKQLPYLTSNETLKTGGLTALNDDVLKISPVSAADSGNNATLSQFAAEYPGLVISTNSLKIPKGEGVANPKTDYVNGQNCPSGTGALYPGQSGKVEYAYWTHFGQKKPKITTNPASIKFAPDLRITMAFDPTGVTPKVPTALTVNAMVADGTTTTSTTTATTPVTTTTAAGTTTTVKSTTTTAPKG